MLLPFADLDLSGYVEQAGSDLAEARRRALAETILVRAQVRGAVRVVVEMEANLLSI